jgi:hypothetical protein
MSYIGTQLIPTPIDPVDIADGTIDGASFSSAITLPANTFENAIGTPLLFRNKIINGNFDIWQRGTSFSGSGYTADRWRIDVLGSSLATTRELFGVGQIDVPNNPAYYLRAVVTSVGGADNYALVRQPIESVRTLSGKTATLTFWGKADAPKNIAISFLQYYDVGAVIESNINTLALTAGWAKYTVPLSIPTATATGSVDSSLALMFWFDSGTATAGSTNSLGQQSGTFDIAQVQLEEGTVATPFEDLPLAYSTLLCARYYQQHALGVGVGSFITSQATGDTAGRIMFSGSMRKIPTVTFNTTTWAIYGMVSYRSVPAQVDRTVTVAVADVQSHSTGITLAASAPFATNYGVTFAWSSLTDLTLHVDAEL